MIQHLSAQTANGNSTAKEWGGGYGTVHVTGTFDGCTVKLQHSADDSTWIDTGTETEFTSAGAANFQLAQGFKVRLNLSGAGGSTSVDGYIGQ